jgi:hypothetical protein
VEGKLFLPEGAWMDSLTLAGNAVVTLAGVKVTDQNVGFKIKGKDGMKWEYKDKENTLGPIKDFKIDWAGSEFDYHVKDLQIHTDFIGGTESTLCFHTEHISGAFTVNVDGTTIVYDENRNITTDLVYEVHEKDNTHVRFTLPFQLTSGMAIEVTGAVEATINVADYLKEGGVTFKLVSTFDPALFDGTATTLDTVESTILLGGMITGVDQLGIEKVWTKKDDKHWEYKK